MPSPHRAPPSDLSSRAVLLAAARREPSDAAAVRRHAAEDRGVTVAGGKRRVQRGANLDDGAGLAGEVSADAPWEKDPFRALRARRRRNRPLPVPLRGPGTQTGSNPCGKRSSGLYRSWNRRLNTEIPGNGCFSRLPNSSCRRSRWAKI